MRPAASVKKWNRPGIKKLPKNLLTCHDFFLTSASTLPDICSMLGLHPACLISEKENTMPHTLSSPAYISEPAGKMRRITTEDGHVLKAWEVTPPAGITCKAGMIVVQEIFGLTTYIRNICANLASEGYHVLAPALFDHIRPDTVLPYNEHGVKEGLALRSKLPKNSAERDIAACITALRAAPATHSGSQKIGIIGFCWGGFLAWRAAQEMPVNAAECWYGGEIAKICDPAPVCPVELHFGEHDSYIPPSDWDIIRTHCPDAKIHIYQGADHGFGCIDRNSFDKAAHDLAWQRSIAFFRKYLG